MSLTIDGIVERILSNDIDRREAMRSFESLSDREKSQLISRLRQRMPGKVNAAANAPAGAKRQLLKSVSERSLTEQHQQFIDGLARELEKFAPRSKENALKHQQYFVDQRKITNLKKCLKALQFHITYDRGEGPYLYDVDGNRYVDVTGDNGVNIFGHQPEFIKKAMEGRINRGYPLVGYTEELFKAARLFTELTGHERVLFTQSGTEAVMWALRIARAATQKKKIVIFEGSYHGLSDAVLAYKDQFGKSHAMGLGMLQEFADQLIVLDYGRMEHLDVIEDRAHEIAGVLIEPVQSRHPYNQPVEFLKEIRKLTLEREIPLILDEMVTGFRICPRGAQGYFNVKADIATYGKIPGGGMPTGMIAGLAKYMNYVDGGTWNFDDDSMPSMKRTLMAGTHTRNPVKIAATLATLTEIKERCPGTLDCASCSCFQKEISRKTETLARELNAFFAETRVPVAVDHFSSLFRFRFPDDPNGVASELFLILLRMNGVETSISGNFFLTAVHTDEHVGQIIEAVKKSIETLVHAGFFYESAPHEPETHEEKAREPVVAAPVRTRPKAHPGAKDHQIEKLKALLKADLENFIEGAG